MCIHVLIFIHSLKKNMVYVFLTSWIMKIITNLSKMYICMRHIVCLGRFLGFHSTRGDTWKVTTVLLLWSTILTHIDPIHHIQESVRQANYNQFPGDFYYPYIVMVVGCERVHCNPDLIVETLQ